MIKVKIAAEIYVKNISCIVEIWRSGTFMESLCKLRLSWAASNNLTCFKRETLPNFQSSWKKWPAATLNSGPVWFKSNMSSILLISLTIKKTSLEKKYWPNLTSVKKVFNKDFVHTSIPDSSRAGTKTIPDRNSVHTYEQCSVPGRFL